MADMAIDENEYNEQHQTPSVASGSDTLHKVRYEEITDEDKALLIDTMRNYQIIWDTSYEEDGKRGKQKEAGINCIKRNKYEFGHTSNETTTVNSINNKTQMAPCTLAVNSTNNDLITANLAHIARQFRNEINAVVVKYEQILIDHEKQELEQR